MPRNYHARAKATAQPPRSETGREAGAIAATASVKRSVKSVPPNATRARQRVVGYPVVEPRLESEQGSRQRSRAAILAYAVGKRAFDLIFGTVLLLIAFPIVLLAAAALRIDTPGSPFFFQRRLGKNGKSFKIFKLRGMHIDARERFPSYYDYSAKRDLEFCFHHAEDPRVTRVGKFLRRASIDELPNLWNVVIGDMSLVGPRPEIPEVLCLYGRYRDDYLSVKPGITCLSKCTGRDRLTKRETIEFDLVYVRTHSFTLDLKILWRTFCQVLLIRDVF